MIGPSTGRTVAAVGLEMASETTKRDLGYGIQGRRMGMSQGEPSSIVTLTVGLRSAGGRRCHPEKEVLESAAQSRSYEQSTFVGALRALLLKVMAWRWRGTGRICSNRIEGALPRLDSVCLRQADSSEWKY